LLVVALDLLLLVLLPLSNETALGLALALGGWVYFPLRQALWDKMSRGGLPRTRDVLPDVVALVTMGAGDSGVLNARWSALWDRVFEPRQLQRSEHSGTVQVADQGQVMWVPGFGGLQGLRLNLAARGTRLFNTEDLQRAQEIVDLVRHGLQAQAAYQRGALEERQRIASDLHDDLGAKLLTIAQASGHPEGMPRVAELAREALDDMRLSVHGLTGEAALAADVLADWRAETMTRITAAGMLAHWHANEPAPGQLLSARTRMQLTRVLREAVSNTIRHSGATQCKVQLEVDELELRLTVEDDGRGLAFAPSTTMGGHGLPNIERRVRKLGGFHEYQAAIPRGTLLRVNVPLRQGVE
jgi:signal transduction histidine kinase